MELKIKDFKHSHSDSIRMDHNEIIDAYVINQPHREDRWQQIQDDFKNTNLRLIRYSGITEKDDSLSERDRKCYGLARTHIELIKKAKEENKKTLLILEDDCKPEPNFQAEWDKITNFLHLNMDEWEVFNGCVYGIINAFKIYSLKDVFLVKGNGGSFSHFIYLNVDKAYEKLLKWEESKQDIDLYYCNKFNYLTPYPLLATQHSGYSDLLEKQNNYHIYFEMAKLDMEKHLIACGLISRPSLLYKKASQS